MSDAVLWLGILVLSGSVACVLLRTPGIPASAAALASGCIVAWAGHTWNVWNDPDPLGLVRTILLAGIGFLLGAEVDLARVVRGGGAALLAAVVPSVAAMILVWGAAAVAGIHGAPSLVLAAAAGGASPAAAIALTSELRGRGDRFQRLLLAAPASLLTAILAIGAAAGTGGLPAGSILALLVGLASGLVILMPLSRLATRGGIVACVGAGTVLLAGSGSLVAGDAGVILAAIAAGFLAGNLTRNREAVREAVRDLSLPLTVFLFATAGARLGSVTAAVATASILIAAARIAAVLAAGFLIGRRDGSVDAAGLIPISLLAPALIATASTPDERILPVLAGGIILTHLAGPIVARRLMIDAGTVSPAGAPDAWREAMR